MKLATALFLYALSMPVLASGEAGLSRSIGKFIADQSVELKQEISQSPLRSSIIKPDDSLTQNRLALHDNGTEFMIFDAWVELSGDLDDDGFYHHIKVAFDADTSSERETVYAKLYLSREGGPWYQYADSSLFDIHGDSAEDSYEVLTELIEGYRPGYYEVLIELHSLYHPGVVASRIIASEHGNDSIPLEDLQHDDFYREDDYIVIDHIDASYGMGVSGSFSYAGLILLAILLFIKFRYFPGRK